MNIRGTIPDGDEHPAFCNERRKRSPATEAEPGDRGRGRNPVTVDRPAVVDADLDPGPAPVPGNQNRPSRTARQQRLSARMRVRSDRIEGPLPETPMLILPSSHPDSRFNEAFVLFAYGVFTLNCNEFGKVYTP